MKKKLFSVVVAVAMMVSCVCEASAVFVDKSVTNGEGKIDNVLTYEELLNNDAALVYDVEEDENPTPISSSPTNGNGDIKHVIVVDTDLMPLTSYTDIELPPNSVMYFAGESVSDALMSVTYKPTNVSIYYGLAVNNDGTGNHYPYKATGGGGGASFSSSSGGGRTMTTVSIRLLSTLVAVMDTPSSVTTSSPSVGKRSKSSIIIPPIES